MRTYHVVVVGGGPVGAVLALALGRAGVDTALVDASPRATDPGTSYDRRPIAVAYGSARILATLGLWTGLASRATSISQVHVSDRGHCGMTRISAAECGVPALGYVVHAQDLGESFAGVLGRGDPVDVFRPSRVVDVVAAFDAVEAVLEGTRDQDGDGSTRIRGRLLVAADGGRSRLRQRFGIPVRDRDYGQTAVVANVRPNRHHAHVAYERFTSQGPLALLPMSGGECGLVWTLPHERAKRVLESSDRDFLAALQHRFGARLGSFEYAGERRSYPLRLIRAMEQARGRLLLVGNAAHHLHPVAGQGLNLGLRDAATLAELVVDAIAHGRDPGDAELVSSYTHERATDRWAVTTATDALVHVFGAVAPPVKLARNVALAALDVLPGLKRGFAARAMGLAGRQSRLARGIAL